jgi:hypothetical protein
VDGEIPAKSNMNYRKSLVVGMGIVLGGTAADDR